MRNDPNGVIRLGWWGMLAVLAASMLTQSAVGEALRGLWFVGNLGLLLVTLVRAVVRTRGIPRGAAAAFRTSFWGSLFVFFWLLLVTGEGVATLASRFSVPAAAVDYGQVIALLGAPIAFTALFAFGLIGGAFGVVGTKNHDQYGSAANAGVMRLWFCVALVVLVTAPLRAIHLPWSALWAVPAGLPIYLTLLTAREHGRENAREGFGHALGRALNRWLVIRTGIHRRLAYVDMRGPALGLFAGLVTLALNNLGAFEPFQTAELTQLARVQAGFAFWYLPDAPKESAPPIVLLKMDEKTRRELLRGGSEPAAQARIIRRLRDLGARYIVLPEPLLRREENHAISQVAALIRELDQPVPDSDTLERGRRDFGKLIEAASVAGNVILASTRRNPADSVSDPPASPKHGAPAPPSPPQTDDKELRSNLDRLRSLRQAVAHIGDANLPTLNSAQLPSIPLEEGYLASLPVVLYLALRDQIPAKGEKVDTDDTFAGRKLPVIRPGRVLVRYVKPRPGTAFPEIDYSTVMDGAPLFKLDVTMGPEGINENGEWVKPAAFFKGAVVFLDSLELNSRETPLGLMPRSELLALATTTLFRGQAFGAVSAFWQVLLTVGGAALIGWLCAGCAPFSAGWRLAMAAGILGTTATVASFVNLWIDPVAPLVAWAGAYFVVTQLTYATNESDRDLLRRFAAPQVVEELLRRPELPALGGSRQRLCVLFADVRGFTSFTEQHRDQPERVIETINAYTSAMTEALFQHQGILDKYTGDGLMAFFPVDAKESDADAVKRSVRAALAMRDATEVVTARLQEADLQPLHVGIGMHFGEAVVGLVGNLNQFNYTALGFTVVVAARLQTLAEGGEVIISTEINSLIQHSFATEALPPVEVKGVSEAVTPYRVLRHRFASRDGERHSQLAAESVNGGRP